MDLYEPITLPHDKGLSELAVNEPWEDRDADRTELFRIAKDFDMEGYRRDLLTRLGDKPVDDEQVYRFVVQQLCDRWERFFNGKYDGPKSLFLFLQFLEEVLPSKHP